MLIGSMNNPSLRMTDEIKRVAAMQFDFIDLTHEPPCANPPLFRAPKIKNAINNLYVVGHSFYGLKIATLYDEYFRTSNKIFLKSMRFLAAVGATKFTVHFDDGDGPIKPQERVKRHIQMLNRLCDEGQKIGLKIMLENSPHSRNQVNEFRQIMADEPRVGLHLDVAHALVTGGLREYIDFLQLGRLIHVHLSDNDGTKDQHLPFGASFKSSHDWKTIINILRSSGYDDTITLEVFSPNHEFLTMSRQYILDLWYTI